MRLDGNATAPRYPGGGDAVTMLEIAKRHDIGSADLPWDDLPTPTADESAMSISVET